MPQVISEWKPKERKAPVLYVGGQDNSEYKRTKALDGRTCPYEPPISRIEEPDQDSNSMTPELRRKLDACDLALESAIDDDHADYIIAYYLGSDDEPNDIKTVQEYEALHPDRIIKESFN